MPHDSSRGRTSPRPPHLTPVPAGAKAPAKAPAKGPLKGSVRAEKTVTALDEALPPRASVQAGSATLRDTVEQQGALPEARLHKMGLRTARSLARRHKEGTVHGRFHPGNVVFGPDGAKVRTSGKALAAYLAPEQIEDEPVGPPADVFAWAATMVYAATGTPPFGTGPDAAVKRRIASQRPDLGGLEGPLRDLLVRCLDKNPAARPRSPQVVRTLRDGRAPAPRPRPKRIPRYRWRMMVALAAVVAAGFGMGVLF